MVERREGKKKVERRKREREEGGEGKKEGRKSFISNSWIIHCPW